MSHRMPRRLALSSLLALLALVLTGPSGTGVASGAPGASSKKRATAGTIDTSYTLAVDRPIVIESKIEIRGRIGSESLLYEAEQIIVDQHNKNTDEEEEATREYLKCYAETNGDRSDPAYHGMTMVYSRKGEDIEVELQGDRVLPTGLLGELLGDFASTSLWMPLPDGIGIGEKAKVNLVHVAPLLGLSGHRLTRATGNFVLESYEPHGRVATFVGTVDFETQGYFHGYQTTLGVTGKCTIVSSKTEQRIRSVELDGKFKLSGRGGAGTGDYDVSLTTEADPDVVRRARKKSYRDRDNVFRVPGLGVGVKLPSYYAPMRSEYPHQTWVLTKNSDRGVAYIELSAMDGDVERKDLIFDKIYGYLKQENADTIMRKTRSRLGEGRVYYIPSQDSESTSWLQSEAYTLRDRFLFVKLYGNPRAFQSAVKDFEKARRTLGYLEGH